MSHLLQVEFSIPDRRRFIRIPCELNDEIAEFIGIVIGDGYLYHAKNTYTIGIVGNPKTDVEYFDHIREMLCRAFNIKTKMRIGGRGLRLVFGSKAIFQFLHGLLGIPCGMGKGTKVQIPAICLSPRFSSHVLRGIFDTDGTVFTSKKPGIPNYPTIELTTTSSKLASQVKQSLEELMFRVSSIREYKYKHSRLTSYKVSLYGTKNMIKWYQNIGFTNPNKYKRLLKIIKKEVGTAELSNPEGFVVSLWEI